MWKQSVCSRIQLCNHHTLPQRQHHWYVPMTNVKEPNPLNPKQLPPTPVQQITGAFYAKLPPGCWLKTRSSLSLLHQPHRTKLFTWYLLHQRLHGRYSICECVKLWNLPRNFTEFFVLQNNPATKLHWCIALSLLLLYNVCATVLSVYLHLLCWTT